MILRGSKGDSASCVRVEAEKETWGLMHARGTEEDGPVPDSRAFHLCMPLDFVLLVDSGGCQYCGPHVLGIFHREWSILVQCNSE